MSPKVKLLFLKLSIVALLFEAFLWIFPSVIPSDYAQLMPRRVSEKIAAKTRFRNDHELTGDGLFYTYIPHIKVKKKKYDIEMDENGFRNPKGGMLRQYEYIILGDSIMAALDSIYDVADLLRKSGHSAYNFGTASYSPWHALLAYKKHIVEKGIAHKHVIFFINPSNDIGEAASFKKFEQDKKDWRDYLGAGDIVDDSGQRFIIRAAPLFVRLSYGVFNTLRHAPSAQPGFKVQLPYKSFEYRDHWPAPDPTRDTAAMKLLIESLKTTQAIARQNHATFSVYVVPTPDVFYEDFNVEPFKGRQQNHFKTVKMLQQGLPDVKVVDLFPNLRERLEKEFIFWADWNCHFSENGIDEVTRVVLQTR